MNLCESQDSLIYKVNLGQPSLLHRDTQSPKLENKIEKMLLGCGNECCVLVQS